MKKLWIYMLLVMTLTACGGASKRTDAQGDTITTCSELLTLVDHGDYVTATVADPWKKGEMLGRYALVNRDSEVKVPDGYVVIQVPVESSVVYSSVHTSAVEELGEIDRISGVAEAQYFTSPAIKSRIASGRIGDIGSSSSPSLEKLVDISPEVVLLSPMESANHQAIDKTGIKVVEMADYMESTPLGRAEWIKLIGILYGRRGDAEKIYEKVTADYNQIKDTVEKDAKDRPMMLTEMETYGVWYIPGGGSYMARLIHDAGATTPFADTDASGSLQMDYASVYDRAVDADCWIMRSMSDITVKDILANNKMNANFKAYKSGRVFNCNTMATTLYDDIAFHPEKVLRDLASIAHPSLFFAPTAYFSPVLTK
jgi:iron complex transport system substrate-binding protein